MTFILSAKKVQGIYNNKDYLLTNRKDNVCQVDGEEWHGVRMVTIV